MDRWIDADDDISTRSRTQPQGRIARLGLAGFVQSEGSLGTENAKCFGKIEVVQSKRDQRKAEATRLMPPPKLMSLGTSPPPDVLGTTPTGPGFVQSLPAASGPPKCPVPDWAVEPPAGSRLLVYKDGQVIQELPLAKIVTVFGRVDVLADVVLDHPSISRQHAIAAFHGARGVWLVTDLGSTHGTYVGERQLSKNDPTELTPGVELRFAASTRRYKLPPPPPPGAAARAAAGGSGWTAEVAAARATAGSETAAGSRGDMPPPPPPKRARVCFADDSDTAASGGGGSDTATALPGRPKQLKTVIGFSDGRDFAARVGPRAAASVEGRFSSAVATTIMVSPKGSAALTSSMPPSHLPASHFSGDRAEGGEISGDGGGGGGGGGGGCSPRPSGGRSGRPGVAVEVRPQLREFVERIRKEVPRGGGGSLYEQLPPPSR